MGDVIQVDFGQPEATAPDEACADVMGIVAELEPTQSLLVLSNTLFAVLLAKNGRDREAQWRDLREFQRGMRKLFLALHRIPPTV